MNTTAYALTGLQISDVRPESEVDFTAAAHARYEMKSGLAIDLDLVEVEEGRWMRLEAGVAPGKVPAGEAVAESEPEGDQAAEAGDENPDTEAEAPPAEAAPAASPDEAPADDTEAAETPQPEVLAAAINVRTDGWAYAIPDYKYDQMTMKLDALLEPLEDKETKPDGGR